MLRSKQICVTIITLLTLGTLLLLSTDSPINYQLHRSSVTDKKLAIREILVESLPKNQLSWDDVLTSRLTLQQQYCMRMENNTSGGGDGTKTKTTKMSRPVLSSLYVNRRQRVMYCAIPKVACSTIKLAMVLRQISAATGEARPEDPSGSIHDDANLRHLGLTTVDFVLHRGDALTLISAWPGLRRFIVVRHPFERIISAYVDKFSQQPGVPPNRYTRYFHRNFGRAIIHRYRPRSENSTIPPSLDEGEDVTFTEFVQYLTDDTLDPHDRFNPHWAPYSELCHPCRIDYDYIIKFEQFQNEMPLLWSRLYNVTEDFVTLRKNKSVVETKNRISDYMAQLTPALLERLKKVYEHDFRMFNYEWP